MKNALAYILVTCVVCCTSCSCNDDPPTPAEPTLPPITQEGANTFGCYVNGELWLPKGGTMTPRLSADYYNNCILIRARRSGQDPFTGFNMDFGKVFNDTSFIIHNYTNAPSYQYFLYNSSYYSGPITDYYARDLNSGEFNLLRLDTVNRIMAGTFHFVAVDTLSGDSVRIEDGRFDIRY